MTMARTRTGLPREKNPEELLFALDVIGRRAILYYGKWYFCGTLIRYYVDGYLRKRLQDEKVFEDRGFLGNERELWAEFRRNGQRHMTSQTIVYEVNPAKFNRLARKLGRSHGFGPTRGKT